MLRIAAFSLVVLAVSCEGRDRASRSHEHRSLGAPAAPSAPEPAAGMERVVPLPPRGRWRLANAAELDSVVLWSSHILVRHERASDDVPFNYVGWRRAEAAPKRSRAAAARLAEEIAARARADAEHFAELARSVSEDLVTRDSGGSLGGMPALMFVAWPHVLDALAATPVAGISAVVETEQGFHIFKHMPAPPEQQVSGEHIVIAHDEAPAVDLVARSVTPRRSRAEALSLAKQLYQRILRKPGEFRELVEQYSDHVDAGQAGDLGSWSTHEVSSFPRELETLAGLSIGDVAPPLDTVFGFQILKRTPNRKRAEWAMERIELGYEPAQAAPSPDSQARVFAQAEAWLAEISQQPGRFTELQKELCCENVLRVIEGRFSTKIERALASLQPGQVASEPLPYGRNVYLIVKRVSDQALMLEKAARFELPAPARADLAYFMRSRSTAYVQTGLRALAVKAKAALTPADATARELVRLHEVPELPQIPAQERPERLQAVSAKVSELLDGPSFARYQELAARHWEELMYDTSLGEAGDK